MLTYQGNVITKHTDVNNWIYTNNIPTPIPSIWQRAYSGTPISNKDTGLFLASSNNHVSLVGNYSQTVTWNADYGITLPSSLSNGRVRECITGNGVKITFNDMIFPTWNKHIMFRVLFNVIAVSNTTAIYTEWSNGIISFDDNVLSTNVALNTSDLIRKPNGYYENKVTHFSGLSNFDLPNHIYEDNVEIGANINELRWYVNENESHIEIRNPQITNPIIIPTSTVANDLNQDGYIKPVTLELKSMTYGGAIVRYQNSGIKFGYIDVFIPIDEQPIGEIFNGDWIVNG